MTPPDDSKEQLQAAQDLVNALVVQREALANQLANEQAKTAGLNRQVANLQLEARMAKAAQPQLPTPVPDPAPPLHNQLSNGAAEPAPAA